MLGTIGSINYGFIECVNRERIILYTADQQEAM